jgi:serine/threonine-protein kinase
MTSLLADRYRLEEVLSVTAMARVYAATDELLDRRVIVKLLAPSADRPRFGREARAVAALDHPNIVRVFDCGEEDGSPYMVLEYLDGGSLEDRLDDSIRVPDDEAARVASDIAAGLAHAHQRHVVHRDLKPANVLFDTEGRAKIADFGIAKVAGAETLTDAGTILGTAAYISPEQVRGEPATPASDVYSFGVVLYRMLAGRLPFEGSNATELAAMHQRAEPLSLTAVRPDVPADLAAVATAALAKAPAARPSDGSALLRALESHEALGTRGEAETQVLRTTRGRSSLRRPLIVAGALSLLAGAGVAAGILATSSTSTPVPPLQTSHRRSVSATDTATTRPSAGTTSASSTTSHEPTTKTTRTPSATSPVVTSTAIDQPTTTEPTTVSDSTTAQSTPVPTTTAP